MTHANSQQSAIASISGEVRTGADVIPIITFVNDAGAYAEMSRSFHTAGFDHARASFVALRSGGGVESDPYSAISSLIAELAGPYFILCHQDVRLDQGHRVEDFLRAIADVERRDPLWAVAGNAGGLRTLTVVRCITDPTGGRTAHSLPARVHSLDENFLVIRTRTGVRCSPQLSGFHFYGPDLCLNALAAGRRSYVIDFHLRHLSAGRRDESYYAARERFLEHWRRDFRFCYVRTTLEVLFLSRWPLLRNVLGHPRLCKVLKNHFRVATVFGFVLGRRTT